jgi:hypothetical protein
LGNSEIASVLTPIEQAQLAAFEERLLSELNRLGVDDDDLMVANNHVLMIAADSIVGSNAVVIAKALADELPPATPMAPSTSGHRVAELSEISELIDRHYLQGLVLFCLLYFGPELKDAIRRLTSLGVQIGEGFKSDATFENARDHVQAKLKNPSGE